VSASALQASRTSSSAVRRGGGTVHPAVRDLLRLREGGLPGWFAAVDLGSVHRHPAGEDIARPPDRLFEVIRGVEHRVGDTGLERTPAGDGPPVVERVGDDDLQGLRRPDQIQTSCRPSRESGGITG
jgi:hypothetical protein